MYLIYKLESKTTGKCYIGHTFDFNSRKERHINLLNKGEHHSSKLQADYSIYGRKDFSFHVLEKGVEEKHAINREDWWIIELDSYENGYNMYPAGGGRASRKRAEELSQRMKQSHGPKAVVSVNILTREVKHYNSIAQAARDLKMRNNNISSYLSGVSGATSVYGCVWCLKENFSEEWIAEALALVEEKGGARKYTKTPRTYQKKNDNDPYWVKWNALSSDDTVKSPVSGKRLYWGCVEDPNE